VQSFWCELVRKNFSNKTVGRIWRESDVNDFKVEPNFEKRIELDIVPAYLIIWSCIRFESSNKSSFNCNFREKKVVNVAMHIWQMENMMSFFSKNINSSMCNGKNQEILLIKL
jgi:hypothetical protein